MFGSALRNMNTTYVQNNYYGSSGGINPSMSYGCYNNALMGGSLFSMPYMGGGCGCMSGYSAYPSYPAFGSFCMPSMNMYMPSFMPWGGGFSGFCGGNRFFDMIMSMQLFQSMMNSITNLSRNLSSSFRANASSSNYDYSSSRISNRYAKNFNINTKTNLPQLSSIGYNAKKGKSLAQTALSNSVGFTGYCAKYVRSALEKTGLSNGLRGDAADYNTILASNKNFKEISAQGLDLKSLPAGCILVYDRGQSGYSSQYGHIEITTGSGQAVSDGITNNIRPGARVYVPV